MQFCWPSSIYPEVIITNMDATTQTETIDHQYQCLQCPKHFTTPSALARHAKDKHSSKPKHKLTTPKLNQSTESTFQKPTYKPPILEEPSCPPNFRVFFNLKAKTRRLPPNVKSYARFVAPRFPLTMLQLAERVHFPDLLSKEFVAFAQAYDTIIIKKDFASLTTVCQYPIGITNSKSDLVRSGRCRILKDLERRAPSLPTKNLKFLTEDMLLQFFSASRIYMLENSIPWDDFPAYFLSSAVLGADIFTKVTNVLHGYPVEDRYFFRNFSCFIERIILGLLPLQESYYDAELRILKQHKKHLTGPNPSIEFTKSYIHSDAQELTTKSPYYKQVHHDLSDEQLRMMIESEKTTLLHKIITHTSYDAKLHKLLIAASNYKEITDVPTNELLDNIQSLIIAEKKASVARLTAAPRTGWRTSPLSSQQPVSPRLPGNTLSLVLPPPNLFKRPPPTYLNVPPPNYFGAPPPNLMSRPPPNTPLDHEKCFVRCFPVSPLSAPLTNQSRSANTPCGAPPC